LQAVTRRAGSEGGLSIIQVGDLVINLVTREVKRGETQVELTAREFSLLEYLTRSPGRVLTRTQILEHVWGYDFDPQTNLVDVNIQRLRKKICPNSDDDLIETLRGVGYRCRKI
jgi:DNA-binding response OmpR family regulator